MKKIVFAGPSLSPQDRDNIRNIEIRPPAAKGDLLRAAHDGAAIIGLVDGLFETRPSVWHKEILYCLDQGIAVAGAASMGALRAAECADFGMIGIGTIFREYYEGRRTADADVAVLHAPAELGHAALTLALVDAEETIERMRGSGAIGEADADAALEIAARLHFKDRTWRVIFGEMTASSIDPSRMQAALPKYQTDRKREDGRELLQFVQTFQKERYRRSVEFSLQNSAFLDRLLQQHHRK